MGSPLPFASLLDASAFSCVLASQGLVVTIPQGWNQCVRLPQAQLGTGWMEYFKQEPLANRRLPLDPLESAVFTAAPSSHIRAAAQRIAAGLGKRYGCLHARIEADARSLTNGPPGLQTTLQHMARVQAIRSTAHVFVAVGRNISAADDQLLDTRTQWGGHLFRKKSCSLSYTECALVDFAVCRGAAWFVGFSGSTWSINLAFTRSLDDAIEDPGWYSACKNSLAHHYGNFHGNCLGAGSRTTTHRPKL